MVEVGQNNLYGSNFLLGSILFPWINFLGNDQKFYVGTEARDTEAYSLNFCLRDREIA